MSNILTKIEKQVQNFTVDENTSTIEMIRIAMITGAKIGVQEAPKFTEPEDAMFDVDLSRLKSFEEQ